MRSKLFNNTSARYAGILLESLYNRIAWCLVCYGHVRSICLANNSLFLNWMISFDFFIENELYLNSCSALSNVDSDRALKQQSLSSGITAGLLSFRELDLNFWWEWHSVTKFASPWRFDSASFCHLRSDEKCKTLTWTEAKLTVTWVQSIFWRFCKIFLTNSHDLPTLG